jgi:hypothetical protein
MTQGAGFAGLLRVKSVLMQHNTTAFALNHEASSHSRRADVGKTLKSWVNPKSQGRFCPTAVLAISKDRLP